jgi:hypothetical protein
MSVWALNSTIKKSRQQRHIVIGVHTLAIAAIWVAYMPVWLQALATIAVMLMLGLTLKQPQRIVALMVDDEHWTITLNNNQRLRVQLKSWAVWRYLVVLDFQAKDVAGNYRVLVWPDSVKQADYRRLQVRLRLMGTRQKLRLLEEV